MTQKYHSSFEIDSEFIYTLEELLQAHIPSFEWIKQEEKQAPENIHFSYFLFFGNRHNAPVGFARLAIHNKEMKKSWYQFGKVKKKKFIHWSTPTANHEGIILEPQYFKIGIEKGWKLINEYQAREDIQGQDLVVPFLYSEFLNTHTEAESFESIDTLIKNKKNYQEYISDSPIKKDVLKLWKENQHLKLGAYSSFKEIFQYKNSGLEQYNQIKNEVKNLLCLKNTFLTLEDEEKVHAIVFYIKGHAHHAFLHFLKIDPSLPDALLLQMGIMHFYEDDAERLHLLKAPTNIELYKEAGFTLKKGLKLKVYNNED